MCACLLLSTLDAAGKSARKQGRMPIVMEKATVRGKVVVLEGRRSKRSVLGNLRIQIWSLPADGEVPETGKVGEAGDEAGGEQSEAGKKKLIHETRTDELGMFDLPLLPVAEYDFVAGELHLRLRVMEKSEKRKGQSEPKILLIVLPKEVVTSSRK